MHARIDNPAVTVPGALKALQGLGNAAKQSDVPETTLYLVELRASQINGCSICVDMHSHELELAGEPDERINTVAVWRETPYFTEAERAALALTEAATRLADRPDPVPDEVWDEAARHYDEAQLAALVIAIATINAFNRINATTRQITGGWARELVEQSRPVEQAA
jgi:AhpD family alkylhydroperoxidase